jgi:hypothetical protein
MASDEEVQDRLVKMATNLLEATKAGKISWAVTDDEEKFLYAGTRSSVTVDKWDDDQGTHTELRLLNNRGATVDSLVTNTVHRDDRMITAPWNKLLDDLYHAARRVAYDVDDAINSMLSDIEQGTPSPPPPKNMFDPWLRDQKEKGTTDEPPF